LLSILVKKLTVRHQFRNLLLPVLQTQIKFQFTLFTSSKMALVKTVKKLQVIFETVRFRFRPMAFITRISGK